MKYYRKLQHKTILGKIAIGVLAIVTFVGCIKDLDKTIVLLPEYPVVITNEETDVRFYSVTFNGEVTTNGIIVATGRGFCYSSQPMPTINSGITRTSVSGSGLGTFSKTVTGLRRGTQYYVRAFASTSKDTVYGEQRMFTTLDCDCEKMYGSFTDSRDGHKYKTIEIGKQTWMAENLAYLPSVNNTSQSSGTMAMYYVYGYPGNSVEQAKNTLNYQTFGVLYNWPAAQNACPSGWHLPTNAEREILVNYLIANGYNYDGTTSENKIAKALASENGWNKSTDYGTIGYYPEENNISCFSALPGGSTSNNGSGGEIKGNYGHWWVGSGSWPDPWHLKYDGFSADDCGYDNTTGLSVRCKKN
jgi:uncharacterized protein (TIGR02145 family)